MVLLKTNPVVIITGNGTIDISQYSILMAKQLRILHIKHLTTYGKRTVRENQQYHLE